MLVSQRVMGDLRPRAAAVFCLFGRRARRGDAVCGHDDDVCSCLRRRAKATEWSEMLPVLGARTRLWRLKDL